MSFPDFTLPKVQQDFGLTTSMTQRLFVEVAAVPLSETLRRYLDDFQVLGMSSPTEKGRSELLVAPLLAEVWRHRSIASASTLVRSSTSMREWA